MNIAFLAAVQIIVFAFGAAVARKRLQGIPARAVVAASPSRQRRGWFFRAALTFLAWCLVCIAPLWPPDGYAEWLMNAWWALAGLLASQWYMGYLWMSAVRRWQHDAVPAR